MAWRWPGDNDDDLDQWWLVYWRISLGLSELTNEIIFDNYHLSQKIIVNILFSSQ